MEKDKKNKKENPIVKKLIDKSCVKYQVYKNTFQTFQDLKKVARELAEETQKQISKVNSDIKVEFTDKGEFEAELRFAGDLLIFTMHTNVFEFPRAHEVMKTSYIKQDTTRSYCGMINFYNFLSDSFKYNRTNDVGYLVARMFVNKEMHYLVEGKRQIGLLYNNFINETITIESLRKILESAILYCVDFDLLTPPYDNVKEVSVQEIQETTTNMRLKTGKRLGFRFQADHDEIK